MLSINTTSFISNAGPSYLSLSHGFEVVFSRSSTADTCYTKTIPYQYREEGFYTYFFSLNRTLIHSNKGSQTTERWLHWLQGVLIQVKDLTSCWGEAAQAPTPSTATAIRSPQHRRSLNSNKFLSVTVLGWHQILQCWKRNTQFQEAGESLWRLQTSGSNLNW